MKNLLLSLLLLLVLVIPAFPVDVLLRDSGVGTDKTITAISVATPPVLTLSPAHGWSNGDTIWCYDVAGVPAINGKFKIKNVAATTVELTDMSDVNIVGAGVWYGGGACGKTVSHTLTAHPRVVLDGPSGSNTIEVKDPDGAGASVAPKVASNPTWLGWTKILTLIGQCFDDASCSASSNTSNKVAGRVALDHAMAWFADNSKTTSKTVALDYLNNLETKYYPSSSLPMPMGCVEFVANCGQSSGESLDSRGWLLYTPVFAYDFMRSEMTTPQREAFAQKLTNGMMGTSCDNKLEEESGTISFTSGSTTVTGSGTSFGAGMVGKLLFIQTGTAAAAFQWRTVASVTDSTTLVLTSAPTFTGTGRRWTYEKAWTSTTCGIMWFAAHHVYSPGNAVRHRYGKLGAAVTSNSQTTITIANIGSIGTDVPFDIRIGTEVVHATAVAGNDLTVTRGYQGTTAAASFANGTAVYRNDVMGFQSGASNNTFNANPAYKCVLDSSCIHNLYFAKSVGNILTGLALADDSTVAKDLLEQSWNFYHDFQMPNHKDMFSLAQNGGTASYIRRYTGFLSNILLGMKNNGVDMTGGNWIVNQALNYGPLMWPWNLRKRFNYTDSSTIGNEFDTSRIYEIPMQLGKLYPDSDYVGYGRWHIYEEEATGTPGEVWFDRFDSYTHYITWLYEPNDISCPSTTSGKKCINYHNVSPPALFTTTSDYDPATPCPSASVPLSCLYNPDNVYGFGLSFHNWTLPTATVVQYMSFGRAHDHLPLYTGWADYQIHGPNSILLSGGGPSACGPCGSGAFIQNQTGPGVVTDTYRGLAALASNATHGPNACGFRGTASRTPIQKHTADYSFWQANGRCSFKASFGVERALRSFFHFKNASQDYVVTVDDVSTTASVRLGINLPYWAEAATVGGTWSRTNGSISWAKTATSKINSEIVVVPATTAYAETDTVSSSVMTRVVSANEASATTGARNWIVAHQTSASSATAMPSISAIATISANSIGIVIPDTVPRCLVADKDGTAANVTVTFTLPSQSANTYCIVAGLASGTYDVTRDAVQIQDETNVGADGILIISGYTSGAFVINQSTAIPPLAIETTTIPNCNEGDSYSTQLSAVGGVPPYAWTDTGGLPSGVTLSATGLLSGTCPSVASDTEYNFTVQVEDDATVTDTQALTMSVLNVETSVPLDIQCSPITIDVGLLASPTVDCDASGGDGSYTFSLNSGALATGSSLNASTGEVTGSRTEAGTFLYSIRVTDGNSEIKNSPQISEIIRPPAADVEVTTVRAVGNYVKLKLRREGLDANTPCTLVLRNADLSGDPISSQPIPTGPASRQAIVAVPSADENYVVDISCGSFGSIVGITSGGSVSGTALLYVKVGPWPFGTVDDAILDYGTDPNLAGSSSTAPVSCATGCTLSATVDRGTPIYWRVRRRDASDNVLSTSDIDSAILR